MTDVTLTIDGREVSVPRGATVLTAARKLGIHIPTFCYHDALSIAANCRMCLVETDRSRTLVPACHTQVADGMTVHTDNERVREAQRGVLEFVLVNHPVDCPICDQAGECELQDNYRDHDLQASRLATTKVRKPKVKQLGPHVVYDGERCILCTRCVRFVQEVAGSHDLTVASRGEHAEITTFPGRELDTPYSMCTADLCPVGALTTVPFRFRARVWWLSSTPSVCGGCARGCSIRIDTRRNEVQRYIPRENPHVNQWWMCDEGRLSFRAESGEDRLATASLRREGGMEPVKTREAADVAVAELDKLRLSGARIGVLLSPNMTNESLSNAVRLATEALSARRVYLGGRPEGEDQDELLIRSDKNANRFGAERVAEAAGVELLDFAAFEKDVQERGVDALVVFGAEHPVDNGTRRGLSDLRFVLSIATREAPICDGAHVVLPAAASFEQAGSFTNFEGRVQRLQAAVETSPSVHPEWKLAARLAAGLGVELPTGDAAAVFADLAERVPHFAGLRLDALGEHGLQPAGAPEAAGEGD